MPLFAATVNPLQVYHSPRAKILAFNMKHFIFVYPAYFKEEKKTVTHFGISCVLMTQMVSLCSFWYDVLMNSCAALRMIMMDVTSLDTLDRRKSTTRQTLMDYLK